MDGNRWWMRTYEYINKLTNKEFNQRVVNEGVSCCIMDEWVKDWWCIDE